MPRRLHSVAIATVAVSALTALVGPSVRAEAIPPVNVKQVTWCHYHPWIPLIKVGTLGVGGEFGPPVYFPC